VEFLAVAAESFFQTPGRLRDGSLALYRALAEYFQQDPATWAGPGRQA
jgi:Mlc titration factor MtfA (ptsG expression regulator)